MSRIFLVLLICMRSYSCCGRMIILYMTTTMSLRDSNFYQPLLLDLKVLQRHHDVVAVVKLLSKLDISLGNQVRGHILGGNIVPALSTMSPVHRVFMRDDSSSVSSSIENSAIVTGGSGRDGGRGCGDNSSRHCAHCGRKSYIR